MATNYPGALDSLTNPSAGDALTSPSHAGQHANANDAIEAVQGELGVNPSGSDATVAARLAAIEAGTNLGTNSVGATQIADGAITAAKMQRQVGNLLSENQASGGDALGNTTGFGTWNAEPSYSGGRIVGTKNVAPGTGWGVAINPKAAVTPGQVYTIYAESERLTGAGTYTTLWWSDASNNGLGGVSIIPYTTATGVQTGQIVATAPANAAWAEVVTYGSDADSIGATVAIHKVGLWRGAGGKWALPGVPITGQSQIATNDAVHLSGTGAPEGVITAAPGSTWLQTDSTTDVKGWLRWIKATGTGNTGWVAGPEADTGWRDVSSLLINSWTASKLRMRRVGSRVEVMSGLLKGGATLTTQMLDIPAGFALSADAVNGFLFREDGVAGTPGWLTAAGTTLNAYGAMFDGSSWTVNHGVSMETSWLTNDGWPTSLPGSAV